MNNFSVIKQNTYMYNILLVIKKGQITRFYLTEFFYR